MRHISFFAAFLIWHTIPSVRGKTADTDIDLRPVSVCPATTINYITRALPQQCLQTDWIRPSAVTSTQHSVTAPEGKYADEGSAADNVGERPLGITEIQAEDNTSANAAPDTSTNAPSNANASNGATDSSIEPSKQQEEDGDPLGDRSTFLSFEDWKAQMLEKADRARSYAAGNAHGGEGLGQVRRRQPGIENGLESLGDEGEIELDFSGFVNSETTPNRPEDAQGSQNREMRSADGEQVKPPAKKSKEAGTTSKERFNYASFDCAATVLKTNQGSKGATWILSENKDSYLLNKCSQKDKYFVVELCNDILIDTIVLGNFEFFSSTFRHFRVSISDRYPVKAEKWREIGTFEARNARGVQAFMIENGLTWVRYLKVELLTHYGKEYYCPVSLLRVHGKTMFDDIRHEVKESNEQDEGDDEEDVPIGNEGQGDIVIALPADDSVKDKTMIQTFNVGSNSDMASSTNVIAVAGKSSASSNSQTSQTSPEMVSTSDQNGAVQTSISTQPVDKREEAVEQIQSFDINEPVSSIAPSVNDIRAATSQASENTRTGRTTPFIEDYVNFTAGETSGGTEYSYSSSTFMAENTTITSSGDATVGSDPTRINTISAESAMQSSVTKQGDKDVPLNPERTAVPETKSVQTQIGSSSDDGRQADPSSSVALKNKSTKSPTPIKAAPATVPATQDSFFRSVHRRLQMLEANSSLSLQYIEEQSRSLRDAFVKAEKRQLLRSSTFLETLNSTVLGELRNFRLQYDQIWQSTVLELASQREQSQNEVRALGERLGILADELVWQKRVVYLQFVLIVLCLGLVIFSRNGVAGGSAVPLELGLLQSIQHLKRSNGASVSFAKRYTSFLDSPLASPSRPDSMGGFFDGRKRNHRRHLSDGITSGEETGFGTGVTASPDVRPLSRRHLSPRSGDDSIMSEGDPQSPTIILRPTDESLSQSPNEDGDRNDDVPEADPMALKRAASSPILGRTAGEELEGTEADSGCDDEVYTDRLKVPSIAETLLGEQEAKAEV